ncbi:hypothetical protein, partial [Oceanibacterium hippocampi]|uniref:hypothetical protein n=1 Tax=Oceanibacterium hippocampi TaxID=745714 RepID=UPI000A26A66A
MLGLHPTGSQPLASGGYADFAYLYVPGLFEQLIADPAPALEFLVEIVAWDRAAGATTTLRYSMRGFTSGPSDSVANTHYEGRLASPFRFSQSMFQAGALGGRSEPSFGTIRLINLDGGLDGLADMAIDGREVTVRAGGIGFGYDDFLTILSATAEGWRFTETEVELAIQDQVIALDRPLQETLFDDTAGDLEGQPLPVALGICRNVTPRLIDAAGLVYKVADGAVEAIPAVYDGGVALTGGSAPTLDLANGEFTLAASPAQEITCDVTGQTFGGGSAPVTAGAIIRALLVEYGGLTDPDDLVPADFAALEADNDAAIGLYIPDSRTIPAILDDIIRTIGGFYTFDRQRRFSLGVLKGPNVGSYVAAFGETEIVTLSRRDLPDDLAPIVWRWRVGYRRNWTVQTSGLAGAVTDERRAFLAEETRVQTAEDASVRTASPLAAEPPLVPALYDGAADAAAEAARLLALFGVPRFIYEVRVKALGYRLRLNDTVRVTYGRYGLDGGRTMRV